MRNRIFEGFAAGAVVAVVFVFQPLGFAAGNASALTPSPPAGFSMQTVV